MPAAVNFRHAHRPDLRAVADIFVAAFPDSVQHYVGRAIYPKVLQDLFAICLDAEPAAFYVAEIDAHIVGYIFAPAQFSRLAKTALLKWHLVRILWRWLTFQYGIGLRPVLFAIRNWLIVMREAGAKDVASDARILSIAVHPDYQGKHIGSGLLQRGLAYLAASGLSAVRLEVRPDNLAALHLYEKAGFTPRGESQDTQGTWLVMLKDIANEYKE